MTYTNAEKVLKTTTTVFRNPYVQMFETLYHRYLFSYLHLFLLINEKKEKNVWSGEIIKRKMLVHFPLLDASLLSSFYCRFKGRDNPSRVSVFLSCSLFLGKRNNRNQRKSFPTSPPPTSVSANMTINKMLWGKDEAFWGTWSSKDHEDNWWQTNTKCGSKWKIGSETSHLWGLSRSGEGPVNVGFRCSQLTGNRFNRRCQGPFSGHLFRVDRWHRLTCLGLYSFPSQRHGGGWLGRGSISDRLIHVTSVPGPHDLVGHRQSRWCQCSFGGQEGGGLRWRGY